MQNTARPAEAILKPELRIVDPSARWAGFYFLRQDELVLGPFQGKVACDAAGLESCVGEFLHASDLAEFLGG